MTDRSSPDDAPHSLQPTPEAWAARLAATESVGGSERLRREANGRLIKLFRQRKRRGREAHRFFEATRALSARGVATVRCQEFILDATGAAVAVTYDGLKGASLREQVADQGPAALRGLASFFGELHARGIYFRGAHLGNVLRREAGGFALLDVGSVRLHRRGLSVMRRARNLIHLLGNGTDMAFWTPFRGLRFLDEYIEHAGLEPLAARGLRARVAWGLRQRRARVDLHDKVPVGPKITPAVERVIVVLPERLGDALMALKALGFLAARRPRTELVAVAPSRASEELARRQSLFGRVLHSPSTDELRALGRRSELVLDLHGNDVTEALVRATRAPILTARRRGRGESPRHQVEWLVASLADFLNVAPGSPPPFAFGLRDDDRARAASLLQARGWEGEPFVLVHLGVGRFRRRGDDGRPGRGRRRWPVAHFAEVAEHLTRHAPDLRFVLTGMGPECALDAEFAERVPQSLRLDGEADLGALAALSAAARLVLCADTGPMHLAAALTDRLVAVFLDTDARLTGPFPIRPGHRLLRGEGPDGPRVGAVAAAAVELLASSSAPMRHILEEDR